MPTSSGGLRYPASSDAVNVPGDMQKLAEDVDTFKAPIANPTITGVLTVPAGSAGTPAISPTGDTNTGLAFPADDTVIVSTGGTERVRVNASGHVGIGTSPTTNLDLAGDALITGGANPFAVRRFNTGVGGPNLLIQHARGSSGSPSALNSGDYGGAIQFAGYDGAAYTEMALLRGEVDGTVSSGVVPGRFVVYTRTSAGVQTERMRIDSNGLITGTGTSLGAWNTATYTPAISGTGWDIGNGTITGRYCQIGKFVRYIVVITFGTTSTFGGGALSVSLPVTSGSQNGSPHGVGAATDTSASASYPLFTRQGTSTTISLRTAASPDGGYFFNSPFTFADTDVIRIIGTYEAS